MFIKKMTTMKKNIFFLLIALFTFTQCQRAEDKPIPTEAKIRLVTTDGKPIANRELLLIKHPWSSAQFPYIYGFSGSTPKDSVMQRKLTNQNGEATFNYDYMYHESTSESWFIITPDDSSRVLTNLYIHHALEKSPANHTLIMDTLRSFRVRLKMVRTAGAFGPNMYASAGANTGQTERDVVPRHFGGHPLPYQMPRDTTVTFKAYSQTPFKVSLNIVAQHSFTVNGSLMRDSVFLYEY